MQINKVGFAVAVCAALGGCSLFGKEKLQIDGERLSVLDEKSVIVADYTAGDIQIVLPAPTFNDAWTQNGGNSTHNIGHLAAADKLSERWEQNFGDGTSKRDYLIATPIIADNKVFTMDTNAVVTAFDAQKGKKLWKRKLKPQLRQDAGVSLKGTGLAYYQDTVYAVTGFGGVFALDKNSGKVKWEYFAKTPIRVAPQVGGGRVFVQTIDNILYALDAANGHEIWRYAAPSQDTIKVGGAVAAYSESADVMIAGFSNGELRALKASTGSPLWGDYLISSRKNNSLDAISSISANPVISGDIVFAAGNNDLLVAIDLRSGQRIWERQIGSSNQPVLAGKYLFLLANDNRLMAIQADSGKIVWTTKILGNGVDENKDNTVFAGPLLINNQLLVTNSDGYLFFISPFDGQIIGRTEIDNGSFLPAVAADGQIIVTTNDANIIAYK